MTRAKQRPTFSIAGHTVTVKKARLSHEATLNGRCNFQTSLIEIDENLTGTVFGETMIHEVLHLCSDAIGADLTEKQVCGVAAILYQALSPYLRLPEVP